MAYFLQFRYHQTRTSRTSHCCGSGDAGDAGFVITWSYHKAHALGNMFAPTRVASSDIVRFRIWSSKPTRRHQHLKSGWNIATPVGWIGGWSILFLHESETVSFCRRQQHRQQQPQQQQQQQQQEERISTALKFSPSGTHKWFNLAYEKSLGRCLSGVT